MNDRWYMDPSKVVGVLGFLLALSTLGERMWVRDQEQTLQRLQQLREVTSGLADIQYEYLEALAKAPSNIYALGVAKNTKRQMQIQTAAALLDYPAVKRQASPQILGALGTEMMNDGRYEAARTYFVDALGALAANDVMRPYILRSLGQLYRIPNTGFENLHTARDYFKEALRLLDTRTDDAGRLASAETILTEASLEVTYGDEVRTRQLATQARERLAKVRSLSPFRAQLIQIAEAFDRGEQYAQTQTRTVGQESPAHNGTSCPPAGSPVQALIEVWAPVPGQISGAEMVVSIDGKEIGTLSNLGEKRRLELPALSPGVHSFAFTNLRAYFIDPLKRTIHEWSRLELRRLL